MQLAGGALALGGGGNENAAEGSLKINGDIIIGTDDSENIDSAMIGRTGHWIMDGNLTLNKSGYLEVGQPYQTDDGTSMKLSTLTITENHQFNLNSDLDLNENKIGGFQSDNVFRRGRISAPRRAFRGASRKAANHAALRCLKKSGKNISQGNSSQKHYKFENPFFFGV